MTRLSRIPISLILCLTATFTLQAAQIKQPSKNHIITALNSQTTMQRIDFLNQLNLDTSWTKIKYKRVLRRGDSHPSITEITRRLVILQDLAVEPDHPVITKPNQYSNRLKWAIISFQKRHGLMPDGIIGRRTLAWLNVSPQRRADLLNRNMDRQQHFFETVSNNYLLVNIPQFQLGLIEQGKIILNSRVIVGKQKRQTPLINAEVKNIVINPGWNVPRTIVDKDILPKIRKNGNYLAERNYEVFDYSGNQLELANFDWSNLATGQFPFRLRQKPGPSNALGRVKFFLDNDQAIYLHDTPNKKLFNRYQRTFSSGCVRVEKASELANWFGQQRVLSKKHWRRAKKDPYLNQWLKLNEPLPVHLVYWTAWLDENNQAQFRSDIYNKDVREFISHEHNMENNQDKLADESTVDLVENSATLVRG